MSQLPLPPVPNTPLVENPTSDAIWKRWLEQLRTRFILPGQQDHNTLFNLQGGTTDEYYHLTQSQHSEITGDQSANTVYAGPSSGGDAAPAFRSLVLNDLPIVLTSGTYTPTLTDVTNITSSTAYACQYLRVGSVVTVSGRVDVDVTGAGAVELGLSLPIASNYSAVNQCGGNASTSTGSDVGAAILADATNDRASFQWVSADSGVTRDWYFSFTYLIV
jgi:hypothetical protein